VFHVSKQNTQLGIDFLQSLLHDKCTFSGSTSGPPSSSGGGGSHSGFGRNLIGSISNFFLDGDNCDGAGGNMASTMDRGKVLFREEDKTN
jgi:hypothetical protein